MTARVAWAVVLLITSAGAAASPTDGARFVGETMGGTVIFRPSAPYAYAAFAAELRPTGTLRWTVNLCEMDASCVTRRETFAAAVARHTGNVVVTGNSVLLGSIRLEAELVGEAELVHAWCQASWAGQHGGARTTYETIGMATRAVWTLTAGKHRGRGLRNGGCGVHAPAASLTMS